MDSDPERKMAKDFSIKDEFYIRTDGEETPDLDDTAFIRSFKMGTSKTFKRSILALQMDNPALLQKIQFKPLETGENPYDQLMKPVPMPKSEIIKNGATTNKLNFQLEKFLARNLLTPKQYQLRWQIAFDILFILRQNYPSCELYIFGSLLTGLGDSTSDIDIYLDFKGDGGRSLDKNPKTKPLIIYDIQLGVSHIFESAKCRYTSCNDKDESSDNHLFAVKVEMIGSRVPIVRFQHQKSGISCDISFGSRMAVQNTKLLQFYLNFDPRVRPLVVYVRRWGKKHNLLGSWKIKKYALFLLLLVYLTKKKVVPSVSFLQELAEKQRKDLGKGAGAEIIEGWDTGFCEDLELIEKYFGKKRCPLPGNYEEERARVMLEMAWEFFQMMGSMDFGRKVVCPFIGNFVRKGDLIDLENARERLPGKLKKWREGWGGDERAFCRELGIYKQMVIQDPFVWDFNVACLVDQETLGRFKEACKTII